MNRLTVSVLLVIVAVVLFPPADRMKSVEGQDMWFKEGYTFIAKTGGAVQIRFEEWLSGIAVVAVLGGAVVLSGPIRSRMSSGTRRIALRIISSLLILGPIVSLGCVALFAWLWTDSTTWGAWSKGTQTQSEHFDAFFAFMLRKYWLQILASAVMVTIGIYIWPRRLADSGSRSAEKTTDAASDRLF